MAKLAETATGARVNVFSFDIGPYVSTCGLLCMLPRIYYVYSLGGLSKLDGSGMESPDRGKDVCTTVLPWYKRAELVKVAGVVPTELQELEGGSQSTYYLISIVLD